VTVEEIYEQLLLAKNETPAMRLEVIWGAFESTFDRKLERPPTPAERAEVQAWLRCLRASGPVYGFAYFDRLLQHPISLSMTEKASWMVQSRCGVCEPVVRPDGSFPLNLHTPIDIDPWSSQSEPGREAVREAVRHEMSARSLYQPYGDGPLCVSVVSVVPRAQGRKDADNLVKGLLDSLQGVLYTNDNQIQCLTSRRVTFLGPTGYYLFGISAVEPYDADVVLDDALPARILTGKRIERPRKVPGSGAGPGP
jgi:Endodeoxyribonuclease RusA